MRSPPNFFFGTSIEKRRRANDRRRSKRVLRTSRTFNSRQIASALIAALCLFNESFAYGRDGEAYTTVMLRAQAALDNSYVKAASAAQADTDASTAAKEACETGAALAKDKAARLDQQAQLLTEEANVWATKALEEFQSAEALATDRPEPIFGEGLALLQLQRYCAAIDKITAVRNRNYRTPETTFALGNALINSSGLGSPGFDTGITLLAQYINEAESSSNPNAFPNLEIAKSLKTVAEGKHDKLIASTYDLDEQPNRAKCPLPEPPRTELPFSVSLSSALGYNDNVKAFGRGLALPAGTSQKDSWYNESSFTLSRVFPLSHASALSSTGHLLDTMSLAYVFVANTFDAFHERDRLLHTFQGSYQRSFTPHVAGLVKVSDQLLYINQEQASNLLSAQEGVAITVNTRWKFLLSYYLIRIDGFGPSTAADDPDGFVHRAELSSTVTVIRDKDDFSPVLTATGQYGHEWNEPAGRNGKFERDDLLGKLEWKVYHARTPCSFVRGITMVVSEQWQPDQYRNATFPAATGTGLFARSENTNAVTVAVRIAMWYDQLVADTNRLEVILNCRHVSRDSNVRSNTYDQNQVLLSLKLNL